MALISTSSYGAGQHIRYSGTGLPNLRAAHTIMVRVKHGSTATNYDSIILGYQQTTGTFGNGGSDFGRNNGLASTSINSYRLNDVGTVNGVAANAGCYGNTSTWYHLAFTYDATSIRFYVDGTLISTTASGTTAAPNSTSNSIWLGMHNGKFADFAFFNSALSQSNIQLLCDYRVPQYTTGLLAFWRLDSDASDSSGNGRNGSTSSAAPGTGTPTLSYSTSDNPPQPETPIVDLTAALASSSAFAATMTSIKPLSAALASSSAFAAPLSVNRQLVAALASSSAFAAGLTSIKPLTAALASGSAFDAYIRPRWSRRFNNDVAISAFVGGRPASSPWTIMGWQRIIDPITSSTSGVTAEINGTAALVTAGWSVSGSQRRIDFVVSGMLSQQINTDDQWHHVALVHDGTTLRPYIDGVAQSTAASSFTGNHSFMNIYNLSASAIHESAQVKWWHGAALSPAQIVTEMTYHNPTNALGSLVGWWQLTWQNPTADSSGNGYTLDNSGREARWEPPGTFATNVALTAALASSSVFSATLQQQINFAVALASSSAFSATASLDVGLAVALASSSAFAATPTAQLAAALQSSSAFAATLGVQGSYSAHLVSSSVFSANMTQLQPLAAALASTSTFQAALTLGAPMQVALQTDSAFAAAMTAQLRADLASSSQWQAALTVLKPMQVALASSSAFAASMLAQITMQANLASSSAFSASLTVLVLRAFQVALATQSAFGATMRVTQTAAAGGVNETTGSATAYYGPEPIIVPRVRRWPTKLV